MDGKVLGSYVHVENKKGEVVVLSPGQELPAWAKDLVTNPAAFRDAETVESSEATSTTESADGYAALSGDALKAELKKRELPQSGRKAELIARLEKDDAEKAAAASTGSESGDGSEGDAGAQSGGGSTEEE